MLLASKHMECAVAIITHRLVLFSLHPAKAFRERCFSITASVRQQTSVKMTNLSDDESGGICHVPSTILKRALFLYDDAFAGQCGRGIGHRGDIGTLMGSTGLRFTRTTCHIRLRVTLVVVANSNGKAVALPRVAIGSNWKADGYMSQLIKSRRL